MTSSHESARWTCPHCFIVIPWTDTAGIRDHNCEAIQKLISGVRSKTAKLDATIKALQNPTPSRKGRGRYKEKKHG